MGRRLKAAGVPIYTYAFAIIIAMVSNAKLDKYQDDPKNAADRSEHPGLATLADNKWYLMVFLVVLAGIPAAWIAVKKSASAESQNIEVLRRYLRIIRGRAFPDVDGTKSNVRLALWMLSKDGKQLECVYRTDETKPKRTWAIDQNQGFVVRAFRYQVEYRVDELVDETDADRRKTYLTESWATDEILADRSWKGAAMLAIPVVVSPGEHPKAVFLVEAKGMSLATVSFYDADMDTCCMLMEDLS